METSVYGYMCGMFMTRYLTDNILHFLFPGTERRLNVGQRNADVRQRYVHLDRSVWVLGYYLPYYLKYIAFIGREMHNSQSSHVS